MEEEEIPDEEIDKLYEYCIINNCSNYMNYLEYEETIIYEFSNY